MEKLATEVLAQIVDLLDPEDIAHFIGVGNFRLITIMRSQRVVERLAFSQRGAFPRFVRHFQHLRALSLEDLLDDSDLTVSLSTAALYPQSLTSLSLKGVLVTSRSNFLPLGPLPSLTRLVLITRAPPSENLACDDDLFNSLHTFPCLQDLSLCGFDLTPEAAALLPATLESFSYHTAYLVPRIVEIVMALPRSLKSFWLDQPRIRSDFSSQHDLLLCLAHLPPGLTSFSDLTFLGNHALPEDIAKLPQGLTALHQLDMRPGFLAVLPPALTSLSVGYGSIGFDDKVSFPSTLTELFLNETPQRSALINCVLNSLLPRLTRLDLRFIRPDQLPEGALPVSLTDLEIEGEPLGRGDYKPFIHLTNLKRLEYYIMDCPCPHPDFVASLPTSLTCIAINPHQLGLISGSWKGFDRALISLFSRFVHLQTLQVTSVRGPLKKSHIATLPRSLTLLELEHFGTKHHIVAAECFEKDADCWPPKLRLLSLSGSLPPLGERPRSLPYLIDFLSP